MNLENKEVFISKLIILEKPLYIIVTWINDGNTVFDIKVFFENQSWTGTFPSEAAIRYIDKLKDSSNNYYNDVKICLSKENPMYKYDFKISEIMNSATFSWKKLFEGSTAVLVHGSLELKYNSLTENNFSLIDFLLGENEKLKMLLATSDTENKRLNCEINKINLEFNKHINMKCELEDTLYGKFVQVLNEKKKRIQILEDAMKQIENR